jgi:glycosyltransferase involved in cell wall biosynthesis
VTEPSVTAIVATRNRRELLARTLRAIWTQSHEFVTVVVIDEASTDGTVEWLETLAGDRLRFVRNATPGGVARARNQGLALASGTYVAFCDDDDLWAPSKIRDQLDALAERPGSRWCYTGAMVVDAELRPLRWQRCPSPDDLAARLLHVNEIPGGASGVIAERSLVEEVGAFDPGYLHFADWDLWIRMALAAPAAAIDRPLLGYLRHRSMSTVARGRYEDLDRLRDKYVDERRARHVSSSDVPVLHWIGEMSLRGGDRRAAAAAYWRAARSGESDRSGLRWALSLVPGSLAVYDRLKTAAIPRDKREEAETWLAPVRAGPPELDAPR